MIIDIKKLLYKYRKFEVALENINRALQNIHAEKKYPSCTPSYSDDILGRGGFPSSTTERCGIANIMEEERVRAELEQKKKEYEEVVMMIRKAIDTLNERQRKLIELKYFHEYSYGEIMDVMHIASTATYHWYHRTAIEGLNECMRTLHYLSDLVPMKEQSKHRRTSKKPLAV